MKTLNQDGFSLLEALVASGVGIVMMLGFLSSMDFSNRSVQSVSAKLDFNSLVTTVQSVLSNSTNCQKALKDVQFNPPAAGGPVNVSLLPLTSDGATGVVLVPSGPLGKSLNVTELSIFDSVPLGAGHLVRIRLKATKLVGGGTIGAQEAEHEFRAVVTVGGAPSKITGCSGASSEYWKSDNGTDIYYNAGNVGIGTNTPQYLTHWVANANAYKTIRVDNEDPGPVAMAALELKSDAILTQLHAESVAHGGHSTLQTNATAGLMLGAYTPGSRIKFHVGNDWTDPQGPIVTFRGNGIGIRTADPVAELDVNGLVRMKKHGAEPFPCTPAKDGVMALTNRRMLCVCDAFLATWVRVSDGQTGCVWPGF